MVDVALISQSGSIFIIHKQVADKVISLQHVLFVLIVMMDHQLKYLVEEEVINKVLVFAESVSSFHGEVSDHETLIFFERGVEEVVESFHGNPSLVYL